MWPTPKLFLKWVATESDVNELLAVARDRFKESPWDLAMVRFGSLSCCELSAKDMVLFERESSDLLKPDSHWTGTPLFQAIQREFSQVEQHLAYIKTNYQIDPADTHSGSGLGSDPAATMGATATREGAKSSNMTANSPIGSNERLARAKQELATCIGVMQARWMDEGRDPSKLGFMSLSSKAAGLAATLGFPCPPVEYVPVNRPAPHRLLDENPSWEYVNTLRVRDPNGLTYAEVPLSASAKRTGGHEDNFVGDLMPPTGVYDLIDRTLRSWRRLVGEIDLLCIRYSVGNYTNRQDSMEIMEFRYQLARELQGRGDRTPTEEAEVALRAEELQREGAEQFFRQSEKDHNARYRVAAKLKTLELSGGRQGAETSGQGAMPGAPGDMGANNLVLEPALDEEAIRVLCDLNDHAPRLRTLVAIEEATHVSRKTAGKRLNSLIDNGLATRPRKKRKGATITEEGRRLADRLRPQATH